MEIKSRRSIFVNLERLVTGLAHGISFGTAYEFRLADNTPRLRARTV